MSVCDWHLCVCVCVCVCVSVCVCVCVLCVCVVVCTVYYSNQFRVVCDDQHTMDWEI